MRAGNGVDEYLDGVQGSPALHGQTLRFTPSLECPSVLYYQCTKQKNMGYKIYVVDSQAQVGRPIFVPRATPTVYDELSEGNVCQHCRNAPPRMTQSRAKTMPMWMLTDRT